MFSHMHEHNLNRGATVTCGDAPIISFFGFLSKHMYAKLGIHTWQELIDLVDKRMQ
jgi:hypothetical protein